MKRPQGVTVLACLYLWGALAMLIALIPTGPFSLLQHPGLVAQSVVDLIIGVTLCIALLKMKTWSRWLAITFSAAQLLFSLYAVAVADGSIAVGRIGFRTLFAVCVIWYLTRPHVKTAFQSA
jgi:hypothetical protein